MGGIPGDYPFTERLRDVGGETAALAPVFVIPGAAERATRVGSALLLPHHSDYYHPDLVAAADAVVGKLGYSTVAEVYGAGVPFGYVPLEDFRESPVLARFVSERLPSIAIDEDEFTSGDWLARLPGLLDLPRLDAPTRNGADEAASAILQRLEP
jgi:UDP-N-acetylglucosamine:LPS N-acetylglucosamine transferase